MGIYEKVFGDPSKKQVKRIQPIVKKINDLEGDIEKLSDEDLKNKTLELKNGIKKRMSQFTGDPLDDIREVKDAEKEKSEKIARQEKKVLDEILPEAFALVREASKRILEMRHYDVQLTGGVVLHDGKIAEMRTGEGKTLVSTLPIYLNALMGKGVHVVTVNDYLAKRDAQWMGKVFDFLGLTIGVIVHDHAYLVDYNKKEDPSTKSGEEKKEKLQVEIEKENLVDVERKEAYSADITYGTNNEFGFDYLRDNMVRDLSQKAQRDLYYAVIDEIDSILIDEARTPLIISAPAEESGELYRKFSAITPNLDESTDYNLDEKMRAVTLTDDGIKKVEGILGIDNIYNKGVELVHHLEQALKAQVLFQKDRDYVVKDGEIIIVDEFTGRMMQGRRYSEGLHQAIEAKEKVEIKRESITMASITFQNYFRLYSKLSGMTGTAMTESEEFFKIYKIDVVEVPTNRDMVRIDLSDKIYRTEEGKIKALVKVIKEKNEKGQPVLVGTISIEKNELLSQMLKMQGIEHEILNAKQHEREAQIISQAGKKGAVTIATNMAGRGVDIILGGHPFNEEKADEIKGLGGLCVFGTERHESRRIDNQLRGRAGRQGDPGVSQFLISMEDDLMRVFGAERIKKLMTTLGIPEDQHIENKMVSRAIETAQKKVEGHNFDIRKHVLEYDDVMNRQRAAVYTKRNKILIDKDEINEKEVSLIEKAKDVFRSEIKNIVMTHAVGEEDEWNRKEIWENLITIVDKESVGFDQEDLKEIKDVSDIEKKLISVIDKQFEDRLSDIGEKETTNIIKLLYLRVVDMFWVQHLTEMDHLRTGIGLVGYGQKNPLTEYKHKSFNMFKQLLGIMDSNFTRTFFKVRIEKRAQGEESGSKEEKKKTVSSKNNKLGRNDLCTCGSGKKYKKCCGK